MIENNNLTVDEYMDVINTIGWKCPSKRLLEKSLKNSITAKYILDGETVGIARLVTDGGYIGLIADVMVKPSYQRRKIGTQLIESLLKEARKTLEDGEAMMIQLLAADGKAKFYEQFGFKNKPEVVEAGMYMWTSKE